MSTEDLSDTITPKSDQLNADDLLTGPITVKITNVTRGPKDQPISIAIPPHQPYKPCKSMRRVLVAVWGKNGKEWIGKSMTLFCDPDVIYGGVAVGGIRISHVSDIDKAHTLLLTTTRSKRKSYTVKELVEQVIDLEPLKADATKAAEISLDALKDFWLKMSPEDRKAMKPLWKEYEKLANEKQA